MSGSESDISACVANYIAEQRDLLARLESFAATPDYAQLLSTIAPLAAGDIEPWFVEWLVSRPFSLRELPLDVLDRPGGKEVIADMLERSIYIGPAG